MSYLYLTLAVITEVIATTALKNSDNFTRLWPSVIVLLGYGTAFYSFSLALKAIPMGISYAIWSGAGIALLTLIGAVFYKQTPSLQTIAGILCIVGGIVLINLSPDKSIH